MQEARKRVLQCAVPWLTSPNQGGIEPIMATTGYDLTQYYVLSRNDVNSGRVQADANANNFQAWENADSLAFLKLNGQMALMGVSTPRKSVPG